MKEDLTCLKENHIEVRITLCRQEQFSKRNYLLEHGADKVDQAIIKFIKNDMEKEIVPMILIVHTA